MWVLRQRTTQERRWLIPGFTAGVLGNVIRVRWRCFAFAGALDVRTQDIALSHETRIKSFQAWGRPTGQASLNRSYLKCSMWSKRQSLHSLVDTSSGCFNCAVGMAGAILAAFLVEGLVPPHREPVERSANLEKPDIALLFTNSTVDFEAKNKFNILSSSRASWYLLPHYIRQSALPSGEKVG